jgi:hypothetical protein
MARWSFSGSADDVSGNGNHGVVMGGTALTTDRFGSPNSAYSFSGLGSCYIEIPNSASLRAPTTAMTMAAWILMMSDGSGWNPILMKSVAGENAFMYRMLAASTYVCAAFSNWNVAACTGATIPLNEWHHVATTFDGLTSTVGWRARAAVERQGSRERGLLSPSGRGRQERAVQGRAGALTAGDEYSLTRAADTRIEVVDIRDAEWSWISGGDAG